MRVSRILSGALSFAPSLACLLVGGALLGGCATRMMNGPVSPPFGERVEGLYAGIGMADITPPPGLSLFGHGPEGRISVGVRLRLSCKAFVLSSATDVVALVPCDLAAPSLELQRVIAAKLVELGIPIGSDRVFLMATHTHAGPAHYFGPRRYSGSFSSYDPGFDPELFDWLAERIASAISTAYRHRVPACAGWSFADVYGLSRNRSYTAFANNASFPEPLQSRLSDPSLPLSPAQRAVDPRLSVLRIDARNTNGDPAAACTGTTPLGVLSIFGVHPTVVPNTNDLYHGDLFGYATREIESRITAWLSLNKKPAVQCWDAGGTRACGALAGIANGIEGDVSPAWDYQSHREAKRLAAQLADHVMQRFDGFGSTPGTLRSDLTVSHVYRELYFPGAQASADGTRSLCPSPQIGVAAAGGAEDGITRFRVIPDFNEGARLPDDAPRDCHFPRLALVPPTGAPTADGLDFPAIAPIGLIRVGTTWIATAPAELTTVTGLRIRDALEKTFRDDRPDSQVALVGLTNSYLQYVTTKDEYPFQQYEGASTLYGPNSAEFLKEQFTCLAAEFLGKAALGKAQGCKGQPFAVNTTHPVPFAPTPLVTRFRRAEESVAQRVNIHDPPTFEAMDEGLCGRRVDFRGIPPEYLSVRARFSIDIVDGKGDIVDDDRGANLELRYRAETWTVTWFPPPHIVKPVDYQFRIHGPSLIRSAPFKLVCDPTHATRSGP